MYQVRQYNISLYWLFIIVCIKYDHVPMRHVFIIKDQVSFDQVLALFHVTLYWSFFVCIKIHWMHAVDYTKENRQLSTLVERWITGSQRWIHVSFLLSFFYLSLFHPCRGFLEQLKNKRKKQTPDIYNIFILFLNCSSELSSFIKKNSPWVIFKKFRIYTLKFQN